MSVENAGWGASDGNRRTLLTGASGTLGRHLSPLLATGSPLVRAGFHNTEFALDYAQDLSDRSATWRLLEDIRPTQIVHSVALTNVDRCESQPSAAFAANVETTRNLVDWIVAQAPDCRLVYVSTDQVYAGAGDHGEEEVGPVNVYGLTKLWGEDLARRAANHLVLRTNFFHSRSGLGGWLIDCLVRGDAITVFDDVLFNPLYVTDVSEIIADLLPMPITGTYNLGAHGPGLSKASFAEMLASELGLDFLRATIGSVRSAGLEATRPNDMRMSVAKLEDAMGRHLPTVAEGMRRLSADWRAGRQESAGH